MDKRSSLRCGTFLFVFGIILIIVGVIVSFGIKKTLKDTIDETVVIDSPTHPSYTDWLRTNDGNDAFYSGNFYIFNITNIEDVMKGQQPIVKEVGPYQYEKVVEKLDVGFSENGEKVSYRSWTTYHFQNNSEHDDSDVIYQISMAYLATVYTKVGNTRLSEFGLASSVLASFLEKTFVSLETDFSDTLYYGAMPTAVSTWKSLAVAYSFANKAEYFYSNFTAFGGAPVALGEKADPATPAKDKAFLGGHIWQLQFLPCEPSGPPCGESTISNALADMLFDPRIPYSFTHSSLFRYWLNAGKGDAAAAAMLKRTFGLSNSNLNRLISWYGLFTVNYLNNFLVNYNPVWTAQGYTKKEDIPYLQFGSLTGLYGASLYEIGEAPFYVEYGAWAKVISNPAVATHNATAMKSIIGGNNFCSPGFRNPAGVAKFFGYMKMSPSDAAKCFGFADASSAFSFYNYLNYVLSLTLDPICKNYGCLWKKTTVRDFLFGTQPDPLLAFLGASTQAIGIFSNYSSAEQIRSRPPSTYFTGKSDLNLIQTIDKYYGQPYYIRSDGSNLWGEKIKVTGKDPTADVPRSKSDKFNVFTSALTRNVDLTYVRDQDVQGLPTRRFELEYYTLASGNVNPENQKYYMAYDGLHNYTTLEFQPGLSGLPVYITLPHMLYVDRAISSQVSLENSRGEIISGMEPNPAKHTPYGCVDQETGFSFEAFLGSQFVIKVGDEIDAIFNRYFNGKISKAPLPVLWASEFSTMTKDNADTYQSTVVAAKDASKIILIVLTTVGSVLAAAGIAFFVYARKYATESTNSANFGETKDGL